MCRYPPDFRVGCVRTLTLHDQDRWVRCWADRRVQKSHWWTTRRTQKWRGTSLIIKNMQDLTTEVETEESAWWSIRVLGTPLCWLPSPGWTSTGNRVDTPYHQGGCGTFHQWNLWRRTHGPSFVRVESYCLIRDLGINSMKRIGWLETLILFTVTKISRLGSRIGLNALMVWLPLYE